MYHRFLSSRSVLPEKTPRSSSKYYQQQHGGRLQRCVQKQPIILVRCNSSPCQKICGFYEILARNRNKSESSSSPSKNGFDLLDSLAATRGGGLQYHSTSSSSSILLCQQSLFVRRKKNKNHDARRVHPRIYPFEFWIVRKSEEPASNQPRIESLKKSIRISHQEENKEP